MKKIAYLGFSYVSGTLKRAEAYIRHNPDFHHTFLTVDDFFEYSDWLEKTVSELSFYRENNIDFLRMTDVKSSDFDLILPMSDKVFDDFLVFTGRNGIKNLCDKETLSAEAARFGFDVPKTSAFLSNDFVIAKPRMSSGSYAKESFCYTKIRYCELIREMADVNASEFIIQEFIDSAHVIQFNFVADGEKLIPSGVSDFQFMIGEGQKTDPIYITCYPSAESFVKNVPNLSLNTILELQKKAIEFLMMHEYQSIRGYYTFQAIISNGRFFVNDVNLRIGPGSVEAGLRNLFAMNFFTNVRVMLNLNTLDELPHDTSVGYSLYIEKDGKRLISLENPFKEDFENRIRCHEKKTSGFVRSDYESYIQATRIK